MLILLVQNNRLWIHPYYSRVSFAFQAPDLYPRDARLYLVRDIRYPDLRNPCCFPHSLYVNAERFPWNKPRPYVSSFISTHPSLSYWTLHNPYSSIEFSASKRISRAQHIAEFKEIQFDEWSTRSNSDLSTYLFIALISSTHVRRNAEVCSALRSWLKIPISQSSSHLVICDVA